jgi:hypothetical protein
VLIDAGLRSIFDLRDNVEATPQRMLKTLENLSQQYGGGAAYLARHGVPPEEVARLSELLTEPA